MSDFQHFADLLNAHLRARKLSASAVARALDIHRSTVGRWLIGQSRPDPELAARLADLLMPSGGLSRTEFLLAVIGERPPVPAAPETTPPSLTLHPASLLPLHRNPLFVGRTRELQLVATDLRAEGAVVAITGIGGLGKTQLALELAYRFGPWFPGGVFWISCVDPEQIAEQVAECGQADHLALDPLFATFALAEQVRLVLAAWRKPTVRLLVLDNCEEESILSRWRPPFGGTRVLVTSRRSMYDPQLGVRVLPLRPFRRQDSTTLLRKLTTCSAPARPPYRLSSAKLNAIAATMGDHPLGLYLAGCALRDEPTRPIGKLQLHGTAEQGPTRTRLSSEVPQQLWQVFLSSYRRLEGDDTQHQLARALLARAARLAPGTPIPLALLWACIQPQTAAVPEALQLALGQLTGVLGLIEPAGPAQVKIHELVVGFVRTVSDDTEAADAAARALLALIPVPNRSGLPLDPLLLRHLRAVTNERLHRHDEQTALLCFVVGENLWYGQQTAATSYLEQAVRIASALPTLDPLALARYHNSLGLARYLDDTTELAAENFGCALNLRLARLPEDHEDVLMSLGNLGFTAMFLGNYAEARQILAQVLQHFHHQHGLLHPDVARLIHYLGFLALAQGRYASAHRLLRLALTLRQQVLEPRHPGLAATFTALAESCARIGESAQAEALHEQALTIRTSLFGPQSHMVAENLRLLSYHAAIRGAHAKARERSEEAWTLMRRALGERHSETLLCNEVAGLVALLAGEHTLAARTLESAREGLEARWGVGHHYTAGCYHALGLIAWAERQVSSARELFQRAQQIDQATQPRHPLATLTTQAIRALETQPDLPTGRPRPPTLLPL